MKQISNSTFVLLAVLVAALLRLDLLIAQGFVPDSDEAIVGLMARHIALGGEVPTFYYGQHYMGSLEPLLVAVLFRIFGESNQALFAVPFFFSLVFVLLCYGVAKELASSHHMGPADQRRAEDAGRISALFAAVSPQAFMLWSVKPRGGFIEVIVIGALALWLVLRATRESRTFPSSLTSFTIALLFGFGFWVNHQVVYFALPLVILYCAFAFPLSRGSLLSGFRHLGVGMLGFALGLLPYLTYNIERGWPSLEFIGRAQQFSWYVQLMGALDTALPILLGAKAFWSGDELFAGATFAVLTLGCLLVVAGFFAVAWQGRGMAAALATVGFLVGSLLIFALSSFGWLYQAPRYLLPLYAILFPLFGVALASLRLYHRGLSRVLVALVLGISLWSVFPYGQRATQGEPFIFSSDRVSRSQDELYAFLKTLSVHCIETNYWIGYRLALETEEKIVFRTFNVPEEERIPAYVEACPTIRQFAYPMVVSPRQEEIVERAARVSGFTCQKAHRSGYSVLYDCKDRLPPLRPLPKDLMSATATEANERAHLALDGDLASRWGTGTPQVPGQRFSVQFSVPEKIGGVTYRFGGWAHDKGRVLRLVGTQVTGEEIVLASEADFGALEYLGRKGVYQVRFTPLKLTALRLEQLGAHPIFDWSIAELEVLAPISVGTLLGEDS